MDPQDVVPEITAAIHPEIGSLVIVSWDQATAERGWVEYSFDEGVWLQSPAGDLEPGPQELLVLGTPYGTEVRLRLVHDFEAGPLASDEVTITTDPLPSAIPTPVVSTADPAALDPDMPYLLAGLEDWVVILDRAGRVVWMMEIPAQRISLQPQPSFDGTDLLIDHGSFWATFDGGAASQVLRVKIDGSIVQTYATPGLHHPFTEMGDGSIVWAAMALNNEILTRLTPDGQTEEIASCMVLLTGFGNVGYCGSNTIRWHEATDSFLYSLYSHDTIVDIDRATGQALRFFGQDNDAWGFDPPESAFWWQHGGHYTDAGTLLTSSYRADGNDELVVREYELDEDQETLREIWNYGVGEGLHAEYMGEAHRLPGGNTLHNYGSSPRLREVQPDGTVVWDVVWEGVGGEWELGRTTPIADLYAFAP